MRLRHKCSGHHQHSVTAAQEVDLDGVDPCEFQVVPLLDVEPLTLCRPLVRGAQDLDGRHHAVP